MRKWFLSACRDRSTARIRGGCTRRPPTTEVTAIVTPSPSMGHLRRLRLRRITFVENGTFKTKTYYDGEGNVVKTILYELQRDTSRPRRRTKTLLTNYPLVFITYTEDDIRVDSVMPTTCQAQESSSSTRERLT
jgi:hypothetical protein